MKNTWEGQSWCCDWHYGVFLDPNQGKNLEKLSVKNLQVLSLDIVLGKHFL